MGQILDTQDIPKGKIFSKELPFLTWLASQYGIEKTVDAYCEVDQLFNHLAPRFRFKDKDRVFMSWLRLRYKGREVKVYKNLVGFHENREVPSENKFGLDQLPLMTGFCLKNTGGIKKYLKVKKDYPKDLEEMLFNGSFSTHYARSKAKKYLGNIREIFAEYMGEKGIDPVAHMFEEKDDRMMAGQYSKYKTKTLDNYIALLSAFYNKRRPFMTRLSNKFKPHRTVFVHRDLGRQSQLNGVLLHKEHWEELTGVTLQVAEKKFPIFYRYKRAA